MVTASAGASDAAISLLADFNGVAGSRLRDPSLLSGLLIAAAGAAGMAAHGPPLVQELPDGRLAGVLLLENAHIAVHTMPDRELLLLDVLAPAADSVRTMVDVFARRLGTRETRAEQTRRG